MVRFDTGGRIEVTRAIAAGTELPTPGCAPDDTGTD
jgi:hypothetical protein